MVKGRASSVLLSNNRYAEAKGKGEEVGHFVTEVLFFYNSA